MIECLQEREAQKLKMEKTKQLELKNLEPRAPKMKLPKIIIYGLSKKLTREELSMKISDQNKSLSDGFKLKFRILGKQRQTHWVAVIAPNKLVELRKRGKISMGWSIHSFWDYVHET